jgi:[ribosomal protein S5]-alanine N-acetyltransferase
VIETERLFLRNYRVEDIERVHLYRSLPDFSQYDNWGPNTEEDTQKFISNRVARSQKNPIYQFEFAFCLKENELLIGGCGIRREGYSSRVAHLGFGINPEFQSKGYTTEVTRALLKFGFEELKLAVIYATCDTRNKASLKVMEKAGMNQVGRIENHMEVRGHMRDSFRYEICRGDRK